MQRRRTRLDRAAKCSWLGVLAPTNQCRSVVPACHLCRYYGAAKASGASRTVLRRARTGTQIVLIDTSLLSPTLRTRLQALRSPRWGGRVSVKRDDLLGGGIGTKVRKFEALIPRLKAKGVQRVAVVTSPYGSNAYAAPACLLPHGFRVFLIHPETKSVSRSRLASRAALVGNAFLSSLLVPDSQRLWFPNSALDQSIEALLSAWTAEDGGRSVVLPEGLTVPDALRGAVQLGKELSEQAPDAPEIYLDAGTAHTACGVSFALHYLKHPARITVVGPCPPMDDPMAAFALRLHRWSPDFAAIAREELGPGTVGDLPSNWRAVRPRVGAAFGSVPTAVKHFAKQFAMEEGIVLDPAYSAKMMMYIGSEPQFASGTIAVLSGGLAALGHPDTM